MASGHSFAESSILKMRNFAPEGIRHPILRYGGHIKNDGPRCMKHRGALFFALRLRLAKIFLDCTSCIRELATRGPVLGLNVPVSQVYAYF